MQWVRRVYDIPVPSAVAAGRDQRARTPPARLGCSPGVVYYWIETGQLEARRSGNRLCIPWTPDTEAGCRDRIAASGHLNPAARRTRPTENAPLPR